MNSILTRKSGLIAALAVVAMLTASPAFAGGTKSKRPAAKRPNAGKKVATKPAAAPAAPVAASNASAEVGEPSDGDILDAETVAVQPVLGVGAGSNVAWNDIANYAKVAKVNQGQAKAALAAQIGVPKAVDKGFGFAGASNAKDVRVLHYAVALGMLATRMKLKQPAKAKAMAAKLKKASAILADLTPATRAAASGLIEAALQGKSTMAGGKFFFAEALQAGVKGVAAGPQRAHGYFLAGVWGSGALLFAALGGNNTFADMAEPIAMMLDKDANFGGSDRAIASHLRAIAKQLKAKQPSAAAVRTALSGVLKVGADQK